MIDLHCHLLPGIDDGAPSLSVSLDMARMAVADGITMLACTPHITPGIYNNSGPEIIQRVAQLAEVLADAGIDLRIVAGADAHASPDLRQGILEGRVPTIGGSRYFLFEPPEAVLPPRMPEAIFGFVAGGYVPILTHPERMGWIESQYGRLVAMVNAGAWVQITAGALTGDFGPEPQYWAERILDDGLAHLIATDAHNTTTRPPILSRARDAAAARMGEEEAQLLTVTRPLNVLADAAPEGLPPPVSHATQSHAQPRRRKVFGNLLER